jgi:hypothetical protein
MYVCGKGSAPEPGAIGLGSKFQTWNVPRPAVGMKLSTKLLPSGNSIKSLLDSKSFLAPSGLPKSMRLLQNLVLFQIPCCTALAASGLLLAGSNANRRYGKHGR